MSEPDNLKKLVLESRDEGKVVFLQYDGDGFATLSAPIDEFIKQPADGILYDLNRLEEIALTFMDDPKWVNDFAVALTIRALKTKLSKMEAAGQDLRASAEYVGRGRHDVGTDELNTFIEALAGGEEA